MSRATLLRQYVQDYNIKLQKIDDDYREQYETYKNNVNNYNDFLNSVKAGQQQGIGEYAPGLYTVVKGYTDDKGEVGLTAAYADEKGNPQMSGMMVDKLPENNDAGLSGVYLRNPDGTASFHQWNSGFDFLGNPIENVTPGWSPTGYNARVIDENGIVAPERNIPEPRLSLSDLKELNNPRDDMAGIAMANALGYSGNSALVADQPTSPNSAFFNIGGDNPNNLKDKGILARTLAGEI